MLNVSHLFNIDANCFSPSGLPLLLHFFPGLAPWAFPSRPLGLVSRRKLATPYGAIINTRACFRRASRRAIAPSEYEGNRNAKETAHSPQGGQGAPRALWTSHATAHGRPFRADPDGERG